MKNDSKSSVSAEVDVANARYSKGVDLGIDFANEIDVWSQMEFKARHQISHLRNYKKHTRNTVMTDLMPIYYATRQALED